MRLALAAGRIDVDNVLAELSLENLREWQAFFNLEPPTRPFALLASILANSNRDPDKTPEPWTEEQFVRLLTTPFDYAAQDEDEDEDSDAAWNEVEEPAAQVDDVEPDWKRWQRNIRAYGEAAGKR